MSILVTRADNLRKGDERAGAFVQGADYYSLRVAPTCPPSKQLHMRGGRTYLSFNWGWAAFNDYAYRVYTVPDLTADLSDSNSVGIDITFTNANYYQFFFLELKLPATVEEPVVSDWSFYLHGTLDEFATAGDAEEWLDSEAFQESRPWLETADIGLCYPLCGVVLRNDGQAGVPGAFLPISVVNRGGSYTWPRDVRPRQDIYT